MSKSIRPASTRAIAIALAALLLPACTTVGPDFARPAAPSTPGYAMQGDTAPAGVTMSTQAHAAGPWWTVLGSDELDRVIRQALSDSPTLAEADAAIERARAELAVARGGQGAQVEAQASAVREKINTQAFGISGFPSPTINLYSVGGTVTYDLDLFGGQRRAREAGRAAVEAERQRADAAYLTLSGQIAVQAVRIAGLQGRIEALDAAIEADRRQIAMIERAERAGGAAPSASTAGETQLAQDQALRPPLERDLAAARHQMAVLVGHAPADWTAPDFRLGQFSLPSETPIALPSSLARQRPDILAAEAELHEATAKIGVATADLYPDVRLSVGLTQSALTPGSLFNVDSSGWSVGPQVRIPLFDRSAKARRDVAVAEAKQSLARYQGVVLRAFLQVADALTALAHDEAELEALRRAEAAGQANVRDAQKAYDLGGGPLISVVDAGRQLSNTRRQIAEVQARLMEDEIALLTATGAGWRG
jgi:NodT family efflux transporter outer membrane factor (OMF) lipoprotein